MYHGSPAERAELRRTDMSIDKLQEPVAHAVSKHKSGKANAKMQPKNARRLSRKRGSEMDDSDESEDDDAENPNPTEQRSSFPVVITTYEMIIRDRQQLSRYNWGYIVVDEGHRLKNMDCRLMQEIKKYSSAGRMVLTGTPLHVRLSFPNLE